MHHAKIAGQFLYNNKKLYIISRENHRFSRCWASIEAAGIAGATGSRLRRTSNAFAHESVGYSLKMSFHEV